MGRIRGSVIPLKAFQKAPLYKTGRFIFSTLKEMLNRRYLFDLSTER
jgi:hypothetical protein